MSLNGSDGVVSCSLLLGDNAPIKAEPPPIRLSKHAGPLLFAVNTGCREQEVCQLRWRWEVPVAELQTSVFVIPAEFGGRTERSGVKNREDRVVVLNDVAKRVIDAQRGLHDEFVFVASKGKPRKPIGYMNNTAWQNARKKAELSQVRVHDLKHTFGRRLRTAGVPLETRT